MDRFLIRGWLPHGDLTIFDCDRIPLLVGLFGSLLVSALLGAYANRLARRPPERLTFGRSLITSKWRLLLSVFVSSALAAVFWSGGELAIDAYTKVCDIHQAWALSIVGAAALSAWNLFVLAPFLCQARQRYAANLVDFQRQPVIFGQLMSTALLIGFVPTPSIEPHATLFDSIPQWIEWCGVLSPLGGVLAIGVAQTTIHNPWLARFVGAAVAQAATLWPSMVVRAPSGLAGLYVFGNMLALSVVVYALLQGRETRLAARLATEGEVPQAMPS